MMAPDALSRLESLARPVLAEVDRALATLGAPPGHRVWAALRAVGASPADIVAFWAGRDPAVLAAAGAALDEQARAYRAVQIPVTVGWQGRAADEYRQRAGAFADHLGGPGSMAEQLTATAAYAQAVAHWYQDSRDAVARALAAVLGSAQVVRVRAGAPGATVAAADIGAYLLEVAADTLAEGDEVYRRWAHRLDEVTFAPAGEPPPSHESPIDVRHG